MTLRALVGLLALLLLGGCAGKAPSAAASSRTGKAQRIEVSIAHGRVSGTTGRVRVPTGAPVSLVVTSDVADEVHLHGYDIEKELAPGKPTTLAFTATLTGVFEVELHKAGVVLLRLQVG